MTSKPEQETSMTRTEYFRQCIEIAKSALADAQESSGLSVPELIELSVDTHTLIAGDPYQVLQHSKHKEAYFEDVGELRSGSFGDCVTKLATFAMRADVYDCLDIARRENDRQAAE